jgi:multidrug efflux system outer membrane protein
MIFKRPSCPVWLLSVFLCACATQTAQTTAPPNTPTLQALPSESADALVQWWQRFNDPLLSALIAQALQANSDVRSSQAALRQSRALQDGKSAALLPSVNGSTSAQRNQSGSNEATNSYQAGFDASWEPDVFGGQRSAVNAAQADTQTAQASLAQVQVSMAAEVAITYIDLRALQMRLGIARSNLAIQIETLQIARWREQAGLVSSLDVEQALAASEQTAAQIPSLATSVAQAMSSLAVLTGQAPDALQTRLPGTQDVGAIPQAPEDLAIAIPAQTLGQRPDIQAAQYRISAALSRVSQAEAARYPSFRISGSLGLRALTVATLTQGASVVNALLASISVPLFDGGAARAQVRAQEAALEQVRIAYEASVLNALKEVGDALVAIQGERERLTRLQSAAAAAAHADLLARQRYGSGLIDFRTVLEAQRTVLSTQDAVASSRASLSGAHVRLYKALGGGWIPETEYDKP